MRPTFSFLLLITATCGCSDLSLQAVGGGGVGLGLPAIQLSSGELSEPGLLDFGAPALGDEVEAHAYLSNVGDADLRLFSLVIEGDPGFSLAWTQEPPELLAPGAVLPVPLRFEARGGEPVQAVLRARNSDPDQPVASLRLGADPRAPAIGFSPASFGWGPLLVGCSVEVELSVFNDGDAILHVGDVEYLAPSGEMVLVDDDGLAGVELDPGESREVVLAYTPVDLLADIGRLTVHSDDPDRPTALAEQTGAGLLPEWQVDLHEQHVGSGVDVLFVVDDSCSMIEEQEALADNRDAFVGLLMEVGVDFQLATTSADIGDGGSLFGAEPIVTPFSDDPAALFAANVQLGTWGSAVEAGLDTAWMALRPMSTGPGGQNEGLLRPGGSLRIVFVSDEQDQSTTYWSANEFVQAFRGLVDDPAAVVLSAVTGGASGCSGPGGVAYPAGRYLDAVADTGGISASICQEDWAQTLEEIGWLASTGTTTSYFPLSQPPVPETISVELDDSPAESGWSWHESLNAIRFEEEATPEPGTLVRIEYRVDQPGEGCGSP